MNIPSRPFNLQNGKTAHVRLFETHSWCLYGYLLFGKTHNLTAPPAPSKKELLNRKEESTTVGGAQQGMKNDPYKL